MESGETFLGQNQGVVIDNLHPLLAKRLEIWLNDNPTYAGRVLPYPGRPGSHAEFDAMNDALWAMQRRLGRELKEADLDNFAMHVIRSQSNSRGQMYDWFVRCIVCGPVTRGVITFSDFLNS